MKKIIPLSILILVVLVLLLARGSGGKAVASAPSSREAASALAPGHQPTITDLGHAEHC